jgi:hypothetical protein
MFIYPDKQIYICIYLYIKIDSPDRNLGDGFMIYSKKNNNFLLLLFIHPNEESYHELIYQVIERG